MKGVQKMAVQRKKPVKRSNKRFLKKLVDYLKADSYLFAPFTSPSSKSSLKVSGVEQRVHAGKNSKGLLKKIEDYLSSDSYMYAACINPQSFSSTTKGSIQFVKKVTFAVSTSSTNDKNMFDSPRKDGAEVIGSSDHQTLVHKELVKHVIYQKFRSSSPPEAGKLDSKIRKIALD